MQICIKRGSDQIGGTAIELKSRNGQRIILDLGLPLDAEQNTVRLLPDIAGLNTSGGDIEGIIISHAHQDHYALGCHIHKDIPVYLSEAMLRIMEVSCQHHIPNSFVFNNVRFFHNRRFFTTGSFKITPYLVDHSAYDAYSFLIQADGKRLFYSGDFRSHGRKSKLFDSFINNPPEAVDLLLMEGSCLGRDQSTDYETETSLEDKFLAVFRKTSGLCIIQVSSQNIDRIVTIYRACKKSGRTLVMPSYNGHLLWSLNNPSLPGFTWADVRKFALEKKKGHETTPQELSCYPEKYVVLLNKFIFDTLRNQSMINEQSCFIYSMWNGYKELYRDRIEYIISRQAFMTDIHTSGHADITALKKFAEALSPARIVPVHTFFPLKFKELFKNVELRSDNETFEI